MNVKLPKMSKEEVRELIRDQMLCRISFKGDQHPYVAPFQYVVRDDTLYFHFTDYGKKVKLIEKDNRVCVEIESYLPDLSRYCFVGLRGSLELVENQDERREAIEAMAEDGRQRLSTNFLSAHGFRAEDGWGALDPEAPLTIVKLVEVVETVGLKNP